MSAPSTSSEPRATSSPPRSTPPGAQYARAGDLATAVSRAAADAAARRRRPPLTRLCELRPVRELRGARRHVPAPRGRAVVKSKRFQFEWNLLVLVTAALVLFGLVMVYSATSGSAALGNANPLGFVEKQAIYAAIGVALLVVVSRLPLERIRQLAPSLVVTALVLCLGVLAVGARINGARRWIDVGPLVFQPSELAKLAVVVWTAAYLSRHRPPRTLQELARPLGLLVLSLAALVLVEPDLGTALTLLLVVGAVLLVSGTRMRLLASAYGIVFALAAIAAWSSPYRRDRLLTFLDPWKDPDRCGPPERAGADQLRLRRGLRTRYRLGAGVALLPARSAYGHDVRRRRRAARPRRRDARADGVLRLRLRGDPACDRVPRPVRKAARGGNHGARLRAGGDQHGRRHRRRAADRDPAPVRLVRWLQPRRDARRGRRPP